MKLRIYNSILNPDIWLNDNEIKSDVRTKLLLIANDFYKDTKLVVPYTDVILIGSNANYNYSYTSDLDVHIVIDFTKLDMSMEEAKEFTNLLKYKWNNEHDIHYKTYNIETYIQDINHKTHATGIYSLLNNSWKVKPQKEKVVLDKELIQQKYSDMVNKIQAAIKENNLERLKNLIKDIYDFREAGLDRAGELSTENVVFKLLRNKKYIELIKNSINTLYDKQMSVN